MYIWDITITIKFNLLNSKSQPTNQDWLKFLPILTWSLNQPKFAYSYHAFDKESN